MNSDQMCCDLIKLPRESVQTVNSVSKPGTSQWLKLICHISVWILSDIKIKLILKSHLDRKQMSKQNSYFIKDKQCTTASRSVKEVVARMLRRENFPTHKCFFT